MKELGGVTCRCGREKRRGQTFCHWCYYRLPTHIRKALYRRIGEGYEEAYRDALELPIFKPTETSSP